MSAIAFLKAAVAYYKILGVIPKVINNDSLVFRPEFIKALAAFDKFRVFKGPMRQHPGPLVLHAEDQR